MILANFTPDTINWRHGGQMGTLKPGDVTEFENARANHIVNKFGPRGIIKMQYGDDEDPKRKQAMKIYTEFWQRQVTISNRDNETRKNENKPYVFPSEQVVAKATELGIEVIGPWKINPPATDKRITEVQEENMQLKGQVSTMASQISNLTEQVAALIDVMTKPAEDGAKKKK